MQYVHSVGIDEVGRGPLAGPVLVGCVAIHDIRRAKKIFRMLGVEGNYRDSKKLSETAREDIVVCMKKAEQEGVISATTSRVTSGVIDTIGIAPSIRLAMKRGIQRLNVPNNTQIHLDGSLYASTAFTKQKTIIKGDTKKLSICLASILAKVVRDTYMVRKAREFPEYGFERHKGYGTQYHRDVIATHGTCKLHRTSFCKATTQ